jgi:hypothetical protein
MGRNNQNPRSIPEKGKPTRTKNDDLVSGASATVVAAALPMYLKPFTGQPMPIMST